MNIPIRKKWGQNFIIDSNIISKIIRTLNPGKEQAVLEVGPGRGALTKKLSLMDLSIKAIEIDPMLGKYLDKLNLKDVQIINEDILKFDASIMPDKFLVIGNLPYNISTPILFKFMQTKRWVKMVVMLQKEVAERIVAKSNNKKYGRISIMMQSFFDLKLEFNIPNTVFNPQPKVTSSVLSIIPKENLNINYENLSLLVESAFKHRRKKLTHNLKNILEIESLIEIKDKRAEQLTVEDFQKLSLYIKTNV